MEKNGKEVAGWLAEVWTGRDNELVNGAELVIALLRVWAAGAGPPSSKRREPLVLIWPVLTLNFVQLPTLISY